jgi:hypothetical protein
MRGLKPNDRVSWIETYHTSGNVIAQRIVWGTVIETVERSGDIDGFSIKGTYVRAVPVGGEGAVFILDAHITSIVKG